MARVSLIVAVVSGAAALATSQACSSAPRCDAAPCDASNEVASDGSKPDAGTDAMQLPDGWVRPAWVPEKCEVFQPASPATLSSVAPIHWVPCTLSPPVSGCEQIALDWGASIGKMQAVVQGRMVGGVDELEVVRAFDDHYEFQIRNQTTDSIEAIWLEPYDDPCVLGSAYENLTGAVTSLLVTRDSPGSTAFQQYLGISDVDANQLMLRTSPDFGFDASAVGGGLIEAFPATNELAGLLVGATTQQYVLDRNGNSIVGLGQAMTAKPLAIADRLWWGAGQADRVVLMTWTHSEGATVFYDPGAGVAVQDLASDGTWMSWVESSGSTSALYVAPYVTSSSQLTKTKIRDDVCSASLCGANMSNGFLVQGVAGSTQNAVMLLRLQDLAQWYLPEPPSPHVLRVGWLGGGTFYMPFDKTAIRFPSNGLGTPVTE